MSNNILLETLKYMDLFGTRFTFYTEYNRKLYTPLGGILTIVSILSSIIIFILVNLDNFMQKSPISSTSIVEENPKNVKFINEKIWIPWRIRDYNSQTRAFNKLFYPIIYYFNGVLIFSY